MSPSRSGKSRTPNPIVRAIFLIAGWISLGLGFIGIFLPVLPTVPFVILAALCFSRGSPRWHAWLRKHPRFGPALRDWEDHGIIPRRAKVLASVLITISFTWLWAFGPVQVLVKAILTAITSAVLVFVWTRPEN